MISVPAWNLVRGDRVRVNDVRTTLTGVRFERGVDGDVVRATGSGGEVFRWSADDPVEVENR